VQAVQQGSCVSRGRGGGSCILAPTGITPVLSLFASAMLIVAADVDRRRCHGQVVERIDIVRLWGRREKDMSTEIVVILNGARMQLLLIRKSFGGRRRHTSEGRWMIIQISQRAWSL
jgi:hypothetical protein